MAQGKRNHRTGRDRTKDRYRSEIRKLKETIAKLTEMLSVERENLRRTSQGWGRTSDHAIAMENALASLLDKRFRR